jgi:hypothetical protein
MVLCVTSGNFLEMFDFFPFGFYATCIAGRCTASTAVRPGHEPFERSACACVMARLPSCGE